MCDVACVELLPDVLNEPFGAGSGDAEYDRDLITKEKEKLGPIAELFLPLLVSPVIARISSRKQSNLREWRHWGRPKDLIGKSVRLLWK
jgi:hypothetical protein